MEVSAPGKEIFHRSLATDVRAGFIGVRPPVRAPEKEGDPAGTTEPIIEIISRAEVLPLTTTDENISI